MDVSLLDAAARRLDDAAELLLARAARLGPQAARVRWQSPAARVFAERLDGLVRTLAAHAAEVGELADRFRARARLLAQR